MFRIFTNKKRGKGCEETRKYSPLTIGVIGIGGRTGTMFAFELKDVGKIFGIGKKEEVELIKERKVFVKREKEEFLFEEEVMEETQFPLEIDFDILFLTIKNPIESALKYYYQKVKEKNLKIPALFLSQNGIEAGEVALSVLREIFGEKSKEIPIFRISLFNPVEKKFFENKISIVYSLPIRLAFCQISGSDNFSRIFLKENFEIFEIKKENFKNMEYSKLFLNLIGMASASHGFSIAEGFEIKEIFKEEINSLREFKKVIKIKKGKFLDFPHYPVKLLSLLLSLPNFLLLPFREFLAKLIEKGRIGKKKDLDEIDFYTGAVLKLAKESGIFVPTNERILKRVKK